MLLISCAAAKLSHFFRLSQRVVDCRVCRVLLSLGLREGALFLAYLSLRATSVALIRILVHVQTPERLVLSIPILRCHSLIEIPQLQVLLRLLDISRRVLLLRVLGSTWPWRRILVELGARAMTRLLLAI